MDNNNKNNNISETICNRIAQLRKREGMSQETLAGKLGITFQAVSKWENNVSCPDISIIPDIAKIFKVSVSYLFGEENDSTPKAEEEKSDNSMSETFIRESVIYCDWENDDVLRVVVAKGNRLLKSQELSKEIKDNVTVNISSDISGGTISSQLSIIVENEISNSTLTAGGSISCGDISEGAKITAGGSINCGDIAEAAGVSAGGNINCGDISEGGNISAGGGIYCGDIEAENITSNENIECGDINDSGSVSAGSGINCGDINDCGDIEAKASINCGDISDCGNICHGEKKLWGTRSYEEIISHEVKEAMKKK